MIPFAQFFLTVSCFTVSEGNFVKYPFTLLVNRYSFHMLSLVNAWVKLFWSTVLKFPLHTLNIIYKRIKLNTYSLHTSIICHSKALNGLHIITKRV